MLGGSVHLKLSSDADIVELESLELEDPELLELLELELLELLVDAEGLDGYLSLKSLTLRRLELLDSVKDF